MLFKIWTPPQTHNIADLHELSFRPATASLENNATSQDG
jgi:hypothetical protein